MSKKTTVWITKYALTSGINKYEIDSEEMRENIEKYDGSIFLTISGFLNGFDKKQYSLSEIDALMFFTRYS